MYEAYEDVYREGLVYFACTGCQSMEEASGDRREARIES